MVDIAAEGFKIKQKWLLSTRVLSRRENEELSGKL